MFLSSTHIQRKAPLIAMLAFVTLFAAACGTDTPTASTSNPTPIVGSTFPANGATAVPVNAKLSAFFDRAMKPVSGSSFKLMQGTATVAGVVATTADGLAATFSPTANLAPLTTFVAIISGGAQSTQGVSIDGEYSWSFTTGSLPDSSSPTVLSTYPASNATEVGIDSKITASFSENMDPLSINTTSFTVKQGGTAVPGTVTYGPVTIATFTPASSLSVNTVFTVLLTLEVQDLQGNPLAEAFTWTFTTGTALDTSGPIITSTSPVADAVDVYFNTTVIATFNESIDHTTLKDTSFFVKQGVTAVAGSIVYGPYNSATFTPASPLGARTVYTATLTVGVKDLQSNPLAAPFTWNFTTVALDITPPVVSWVSPASDVTNVSLSRNVAFIFNEKMLASTISLATFSLKDGGIEVPGTIAYYEPSHMARFIPTNMLAADTIFTATVATGVTDLQNNRLATPFVWSFKTGITTEAGPAPVLLGTAGNFAILAKSAISTVPASVITGHIGVSPAAATYLTGFSLVADATNVFSTSPQIIGKAYAADYAVPTPTNLTTAVGDMETAYTDAAGRPTPDFLELGTGNIGGLTLYPGLYKWTSTILVPTNVTLSGGPNDVWIFQTSGDFTMAAAKNIFLSGGAQAKNVFWQIAGNMTVGTGSHFEGIMLCQTDITMLTGSTMNGRMLAQTAVSLQQATVTQP